MNNVERIRELMALRRQRGWLDERERDELSELQRDLEASNKERARAERAAVRAAEAAERQAERDEATAAEVAFFKAQARHAFPGTAEQFAAAWPSLLAEWQRARVLSSIGKAEQAVRQRLADAY